MSESALATRSTTETAAQHPQGAFVGPGGVSYRLWAPQCGQLQVEIVQDGEVLRSCAMSRDEAGFHFAQDAQGRAGDRYRYRLNENDRFPDPASRWQPEGVQGPSVVVDPSAYAWQANDFARPVFRDLVIYELHIGTFTEAGTFRAAIERLPFLILLGINAIEIMPVADFAGERNWGYDGVCLYAPAHAYGSPDDLRALVDAAHAAGIAVILDVVYNHFGPAGNYLSAYIGEYLDEEAKTPWGGSIRYGSPAFRPLRELVIANLHYWMNDFRIDGFRLDATHAIVDESPRHILAEMTECIHARGGYAIAEDNRNDKQLLHLVQDGGLGFDAVWADDFHHTTRVAMTGEAEAYLADFTGELQEVAETLRKGWFYSGQQSKFLGKPRGTQAEGVHPWNCVYCISNHDQTGNRAFGERLGHLISNEAYLAASALLCLTPHTPLLFMGQEWSASTPFLFFTDHEEELGKLVTEGRREEFKDFSAFDSEESIARIPDPQKLTTFEASRLRWEEIEQAKHAGVLELYRTCIALRSQEPAFRPMEKSQWWVEGTDFGICAIGLTAGDSEWLLLVDLVGGHGGSLEQLPCKPGAEHWERIFSTRETRFGGDGKSGLAETLSELHFDAPEAVLLRRK